MAQKVASSKGGAVAKQANIVQAASVDEVRTSFYVRLQSHAAVLFAMLVLTVIATWPMLPRLGGYIVNKLDPLYSVWAMAWQAHALATNPLGLFNTNIMYPFQGTLAFDELSFAEAVISAPLYWLTGNPVLSHNAQLLLTFVLSGYGMWLLVRELTDNSLAGVVAGSAFAFSFYRVDHLPHMTLLSTEWLPFMVLAAYKVLWTGSWRWVATLTGFFTLQALSSHYLAFYSAILLGLFTLYYAVLERRGKPFRFMGKVALSLFVSIALMLPVIIPYITVQSSHEFTRGVFEVERYSNTLASFLAVYQGNPVYRVLFAPFADPGPWPWERAAFPGFTVIALTLAALFGARRVRTLSGAVTGKTLSISRHVVFFTGVVLLAALLSLGPTLQISYAPSSYDPNAVNGIFPLPYAFLHDWVPGFQSMRVVARIDILISLGLAVLAGIGASYLLARLRTRAGIPGFAVPAAAIFLAVLPLLESWSAPVSLDPIGTRDAVPPVYMWLARQPPTVLLEYPMTLVEAKRGAENVAMQNTYQYYSAYNWQREVNGSTTIRPPSYSALVHETEDCFPCPRSLDALALLGVRYVVVHMDNLSGPQRTDFDWRSTNPVGKVVGDFKLVQTFGSDRVYEVLPRQVRLLPDLIPSGAAVLLADPALDPIKIGDANSFIGGGYVAALGYALRDHPLYGDPRLSFGETVTEPDPTSPPEYGVLWAGQDPNASGYLTENRVWANEFVALYKRGPGRAASGHAP